MKSFAPEKKNPAAQLQAGPSAMPPSFGLNASPVQMQQAPVQRAVDINGIADRVHAAIDGWGTDEDAVYKALGELNKDASKIAELKRCYLSKFNTTLESDILGDFSGSELTKCLELLGHSGSTANWGQTQETNKTTTETISNAPAAYSAWNGTYSWQSKYQLYFNHDQNELVVRMRFFSSASAEVKKKWKDAVESKWGNKFSLEVTNDKGEKKTYKIMMMVNWMDKASDAHYTINANAPGSNTGGRAGQGGTSSMTDWGTQDTVDVTHEVGHMLGAVEDYFTTDGHDHTHGGTKNGFRDTGGGIMNNPSEDPFASHYNSIRCEAARALGVNENKCVVK